MIKSQQELARKFGISQMSVSRILNNKPGVSETLRKQVLSYIKKNGFYVNRIASSLVYGRTNIIGLLVPSVSYSFFPRITDTIEQLCRERGFYPLLFHTSEKYSQIEEGIRLMIEMRVSGLIITPPAGSQKTDIYRALLKTKIPFVFIDRYLPNFENSYVVTDEEEGSYKAVKYLIEIGHKKILLIGGPSRTSSAQEVYRGYIKAIEENGLGKMVLHGNGFGEEDGYKAIKKMVEKNLKVTAIMAVNDPVAIGALQALEELNINVPNDISVIGFSDIDIASRLKIPLTTVREYPDLIGKYAFDIIFEMISTGKRIIKQVRLKPDLIVRASTKPLN